MYLKKLVQKRNKGVRLSNLTYSRLVVTELLIRLHLIKALEQSNDVRISVVEILRGSIEAKYQVSGLILMITWARDEKASRTCVAVGEWRGKILTESRLLRKVVGRRRHSPLL